MKQLFELPEDAGQIIFQTQDQEEEVFHQDDLIRLFPFGLNLTPDMARPFLLFKDEALEYTLPVAVNPLEAGITLNQSSKSVTPATPHRFSGHLLESLGIKIQQCVFVEIKGVHQYVRLYFSGHPKVNSLKVQADEAMSLCLYLNVPIFATKAFIGKSRVMSAQVESQIKTSTQNTDIFAHRRTVH